MVISLNLSLRGNTLQTRLRDPLRLPGGGDRWEVALQRIDFYNAIQNVTGQNNSFTYSVDAGVSFTSVNIPVGSYELTAISDAVNSAVIAQGDATVDEPLLSIVGNPSTLRVETSVNNFYTVSDVQIDVQSGDIFNNLFGYDVGLLSGQTTYIADDVADIKGDIDSIRVRTNLVDENYSNGEAENVTGTDNTVYVSVRKVPPGSLQIDEPFNRLFYKVNTDSISEVFVQLTNQSGTPLPQAPTELTNVSFVIRERQR